METTTSTTKQKILIINDDPTTLEILSYNFLNEGYDIVVAKSAEEATKKLTTDFSLILLDVIMNGISGYQFAKSLRHKGDETPIIFLASKNTENDILTGFSVGGDDFITKPFSIKEVSARVKAVLKRQSANHTQTHQFVWKDLKIDYDIKEVTIASKNLGLSKTEFEVLAFMTMNQDKILSRKDFIQKIWAKSPLTIERTVDVHITRLRKKLGDYACLISNKSGYGYRFNINTL